MQLAGVRKLKTEFADHPMLLIAIVLLLFKIENKKELHEEIIQVSMECPKVLFKWQHSKSYVMPQPTDLFCHKSFLPNSVS